MHISTFFLGATIGILTNIEAVSALPQPIDGGGLHKIVNNVPVIGKILGKFLPKKPQRPDFCLEWYLDERDKATRDASDGHVFNPGTMPLPTTSLQEIFDVCQNRHRMPINVKNPANKALLAQRLAWCTKYRCDGMLEERKKACYERCNRLWSLDRVTGTDSPATTNALKLGAENAVKNLGGAIERTSLQGATGGSPRSIGGTPRLNFAIP